MTLTIKNADSVLLEAIQISSNPYELKTTKSSAYANEVKKSSTKLKEAR